jgi:hypothetical protein
MSTHAACYGRLFPDLAQLDDSTPAEGKVFAVQQQRSGMYGQQRRIAIDHEAWDACRQCPDFRACYDLSVAHILLAQAIARR